MKLFSCASHCKSGVRTERLCVRLDQSNGTNKIMAAILCRQCACHIIPLDTDNFATNVNNTRISQFCALYKNSQIYLSWQTYGCNGFKPLCQSLLINNFSWQHYSHVTNPSEQFVMVSFITSTLIFQHLQIFLELERFNLTV